MKETLSCPVDKVLINENKARFTALFVLALTVLFLITGYVPVIAFILYDFLVRTFYLGKYSLLSACSDVIIRLFKIKNKPTDRAPKRFAAGTGLVFALFILIASLFSWPAVSFSLGCVLGFFAFLEAFFGFCAGCHVYTLLKKFRIIAL
jgi:Domain of unknown function (DUF4395)